MKTARNIIKKCLAILLLAVYLFMVSAYIVYHPKHNRLAPLTSAANVSSGLHGDNNPNTSFTQLHGALKSIIQNNRKAINLLFKTTVPGSLSMFIGAFLPVFLRELKLFNKPVHFYINYRLAFCSLMI